MSVTVKESISTLNSALTTLQYIPRKDWSGRDSLSITVKRVSNAFFSSEFERYVTEYDKENDISHFVSLALPVVVLPASDMPIIELLSKHIWGHEDTFLVLQGISFSVKSSESGADSSSLIRVRLQSQGGTVRVHANLTAVSGMTLIADTDIRALDGDVLSGSDNIALLGNINSMSSLFANGFVHFIPEKDSNVARNRFSQVLINHRSECLILYHKYLIFR
jgi:hypothetical protein